jgi:hypothetical protein
MVDGSIPAACDIESIYSQGAKEPNLRDIAENSVILHQKCLQTACERNTSSASKGEARISTAEPPFYCAIIRPGSRFQARPPGERGERPLEADQAEIVNLFGAMWARDAVRATLEGKTTRYKTGP